ncbi:serine protease persephone-like [Homalodisca vitripennis]|nr:serine protease persephone-like [Homalodisca vitripennis]
MFKLLILLVVTQLGFGQQIAKQKCEEYKALARAHQDSLQCKVFSDDKTGVMIQAHEFPATGMLGFVAPSGEVVYLCDATLISDDTLLAAGHCLKQKNFGRPKWARLGATHETLGVEVQVKSAECHAQYYPGHDIAIIKLQEKLNSSFIPACLDTEGVLEGTRGVGVGRPIGSAYISLREKCPIKSHLEVKPGNECVETFPHQNISTEATLCTKDPASGPGDCLSGPLYVSRGPCVHTIAGLASFGRPCYNETSTGRTPSVYTRVSHYIPWIESLTWPTTPPTD